MNTSGKYVRHGLTNSRVREIWKGMLKRCYNKNCRHYPRYGGRGIVVCGRWHDLLKFFEDMGHPPNGLTIERINNDGIYEPANCRWATPAEQARNTRRNRYVEFRGERKLLRDWCEELGLKDATVHYRLAQGWSPEEALTRPVGRWL